MIGACPATTPLIRFDRFEPTQTGRLRKMEAAIDSACR